MRKDIHTHEYHSDAIAIGRRLMMPMMREKFVPPLLVKTY